MAKSSLICPIDVCTLRLLPSSFRIQARQTPNQVTTEINVFRDSDSPDKCYSHDAEL